MLRRPSVPACGSHNFILTLSPSANMASPSPLIKFDVCLYKKDGVSYEDFVEWATKVYPVKAKPLIQKYVVKWTQASHPIWSPLLLRKTGGPTNDVDIGVRVDSKPGTLQGTSPACSQDRHGPARLDDPRL